MSAGPVGSLVAALNDSPDGVAVDYDMGIVLWREGLGPPHELMKAWYLGSSGVLTWTDDTPRWARCEVEVGRVGR